MPPAGFRSWRWSWPLLSLPILLAGCSGTRFGDALSRSFSAPPTTPPAPAGRPAATAVSAGSSGAASPSKPPAADSMAKPATAAAAPAAAPGTPEGARPATTVDQSAPARSQPSRSAPYRVTILLPQADAAAPAEVVTQALRAAGVPFEVETIERIAGGRGASPATPAAPTVRPAPEPR